MCVHCLVISSLYTVCRRLQSLCVQSKVIHIGWYNSLSLSLASQELHWSLCVAVYIDRRRRFAIKPFKCFEFKKSQFSSQEGAFGELSTVVSAFCRPKLVTFESEQWIEKKSNSAKGNFWAAAVCYSKDFDNQSFWLKSMSVPSKADDELPDHWNERTQLARFGN